jgi:lysophospholipase L1-like esterase
MTQLRILCATALVFFILTAATDLSVRARFPSLPRLDSDFSPAFLQLEIDRLRGSPPDTVFLGDSVLWGYRLRPDQAAPAILGTRGLRETNLSYEGGSPVNTYAVLKVLLADGVRPKRVVFNVNQKVFNALDSAYATVQPSVAQLALPQFGAADAALLGPARSPDTFESRLDRAVSTVWLLYALRTDLREIIFGDVDAAHALEARIALADGTQQRTDAAHKPTVAAFEGTYDLSPLDDTNVSVHFLREIVEALRAAHIPAVAILTPTNHALLHTYIDTPQYGKNLAYVRRMLGAGGVRVVDLDGAFRAADFIDNDHLTAAGNERFASLLASALGRP